MLELVVQCQLIAYHCRIASFSLKGPTKGLNRELRCPAVLNSGWVLPVTKHIVIII